MLRSTLLGPRAKALAGLAAGLIALAPVAAAQTPTLIGRAGDDPAPSVWAAPRTDGPQVRVMSEDAASVTVEVTATWPVPLADALAEASRRPGGATPEALALAATFGRSDVSHEVALSARVPPGVEVVSEDVEWTPLPAGLAAGLGALAGPAGEVVNVGEMRRQLVGSLVLRLLRVEGERVGRVRRLVVRVPRPAYRGAFAGAGSSNPHVAVTRSALADGRWFRLAVPREGVYRLDAAFLRDSLGVADADLARVQVYGNGGRILPAVTTDPRPADLTEVQTLVSGDAVLFFAEGPSWWDYKVDAGTGVGRWEHDISPFTDAVTYFVRVDAPAPRRLAAEGFPGWGDAERLATVTDRYFSERDLYNQDREGSGSGLDWMGEELSRGGSGVTVLDGIAPPGISGPVRYRARVAARANPAITITMSAGGETLDSDTPFGVDLTFNNIGDLLSDRLLTAERTGVSDLGVTFRAAGSTTSARAWLDWAEAVVERAPVASRGAVRFATPGGRTGRFEVALQGFASAPEVWDVTESGAIRRLGVQAAGGEWLVQIEASDRPREIVAFDAAGSYVSAPPSGGEPVANQNLHGLGGNPAYVLVAHPDFAAQAERLAAYRRQHDGLESVVVTTDQVFNEFSSGTTDMRAVRDFMKFLYDRAPDADRLPRYLLLFGDGHYDFRNVGTDVPNYVPVFETENMFNRTTSYTSDDYFGVLADGAGAWATSATNERVQVGIGRLPVRTADEAEAIVDKIELYEGAESRGDWRSRVTFVGDDQYPNQWDTDVHVLNANFTADRAAATD
ncbi:MAG TPA: C25 family cysteine peptidase, partial [Rubricoccaceae bacterium]